MSTFLRYFATVLFIVLMTFGPAAGAKYTLRMKRASSDLYHRDQLIEQGKIPAPTAPEPLDLEPNFGPTVDPVERLQVRLSDLYFRYWYLWYVFLLPATWGVFVVLGLALSGRPNHHLASVDES